LRSQAYYDEERLHKTVVLILLSVIYPPLSHAASRFDGTWRGTYNSLHYDRLPEADSPLEQISEFELRLHERKGIVTGEFTRRTPVPGGAV
jgi:hypothetical protein